MKVVKQKNEDGVRIFLQEDNKYLSFVFGGNGDLYWSIHSKDGDNNFTIAKENYGIYELFEELFYDIENINIFKDYYDSLYLEVDENHDEYLKMYEEEIEEKKKRYKLFNYANYNELFDQKNGIITWYSDETAHKVANYLKIKKEKDIFNIEFYTQPHIDGYDEDFHSSNYVSIRFRNSGSSYNPFNILFMKMYNNLKEVDDVNDYGHQIHIEEYLYNQKRVKKISK